jgi:hypothetical protein
MFEDEFEGDSDSDEAVPQANEEREPLVRSAEHEDLELRRGQRQRREPQRFGEWINPLALRPLHSGIVKRGLSSN